MEALPFMGGSEALQASRHSRQYYLRFSAGYYAPCALEAAGTNLMWYKSDFESFMSLAPQEQRTFFTTSITFERRLILQSDPLCKLLLDVFKENRLKGRFLMHEFVIMPNHFHAILTPSRLVPLERAMQFIKGGYSYRAKKEMNCNFEIWQKGSKDHRIKDAEDYQRHVDYIWNNPVRAKLVARAEDFPFSSAKLRTEIDPVPEWLKPISFRAASSARGA